MRYKFPRITDIEQVREAIKGREEFIEADKGDYIIFNYLVNFEDTFPPVTDEKSALLRECRGLIFEKRSGKPIGRRYQKFFNMGEKVETQIKNVDWTQPFIILEKLDGSMITPFEIDPFRDGRHLKIGTKMGETDVSANAKKFMDDHPVYLEFCADYIDIGFTPIFEWCSRKNRIVVDYPEDRLVLTALRHIEWGLYLPYDLMKEAADDYGVEVIQKIEFEGGLEEAIDRLERLEGAEGYIVRFEDGHMLKLKGKWYLQLHKTLEHIQHEKDLLRLVIDEKLDDAKPFLPADLVEKLDKFGQDFFFQVHGYADDLTWSIIEDFDRSGSKKRYAELVKDKDETKVRFQGYDWMDNHRDFDVDTLAHGFKMFVYSKLIERIKNNLSTGTKVDSVRHLFGGLQWES